MSDLYTSAVHLKRVLAGQATAAYTQAPEAVLKVLDPEFFPGMGAVNEDSHGRLQCPVRGCGEWHPMLALHLSTKHRGIGGARAVRAALDMPQHVALTSAAVRAQHAGRAERLRKNLVPNPGKPGIPREMKKSMMARNFLDSCPAQLATRIEELAGKIGRTPSSRDFEAEYGRSTLTSVISVFGTWIAAKASVGLSHANDVAVSRRLVVECLRAWVDIHGDLPTAKQCGERAHSPYLPALATIYRAFGVRSWIAAMRSAAADLKLAEHRFVMLSGRDGQNTKDLGVAAERIANKRASLIADLRAAAEKLGHTPTATELDRLFSSKGRYYDQALRRHFGSVSAAIAAATLPDREIKCAFCDASFRCSNMKSIYCSTRCFDRHRRSRKRPAA